MSTIIDIDLIGEWPTRSMRDIMDTLDDSDDWLFAESESSKKEPDVKSKFTRKSYQLKRIYLPMRPRFGTTKN